MYGVATKKDLYGKTISRWTTSTHEKEKIRKTKSDMSTDSDFEDSKADYSHSFFDKSETQESLSKINVTLDDIKTSLKTSNQFNTNDQLLEYIKSIDSDTKTSIDLLQKLDKPSITIDDMTQIIKNELQHDHESSLIVKHINALNHKYKTGQDQLLCDINTLTSNQDYLLSKIDHLVTVHYQLTQNVNKLTFDYKHVIHQLFDMNKTLNQVLSFVEYQHDKNDYHINKQDIINDKQNEIVNDVIEVKDENNIEIKEEINIVDIKEDIKNEVIEQPQEIKEEDKNDVEPKNIFKTSPKTGRSTKKNKN